MTFRSPAQANGPAHEGGARVSRRRDAAASLVIVVLAAGAFLFPPASLRAEHYLWAKYVPIGAGAGVVVSSDSPQFMKLANHPSKLLEPGNRRQSRPLYVVAGAVLTRMVAPWLPPATSLVGSPAYVAYVVVNAVVLGCAVFGFLRLVAGAAMRLVAIGCAVMLVATPLGREFFWTPHTQMFLVLVPVLCMLADRALRTGARPSRARLLGLGLASGALVLTYGSGVLVAGAATVGLLVHHWRAGSGPISRRAAGDVALLLGGLLVLPGVWLLVTQVTIGTFYSDEIGRFRQFVWLADAWSAGQLGDRLTANLARFASLAAEATRPAWVLLLVATLLAATSRVHFGDLDATRRVLVGVATTTFVLTAVFFALLGTYNWRLASALLPPLLTLAAMALDAAATRLGRWGPPVAGLVLGAGVLHSWLS